MKKITLAIFAVAGLCASSFAQANYSIEAPPNNNSTSQFRAPNGTQDHAFQRSIMFIHPYELLPMNLSTINSMSFQLTNGTASQAVSGNITIWLGNSSDMDYIPNNINFSTSTGTMTQVYSGPMTIPTGAGAQTISVPFSTNFNFTGGSMFVAWDWTSTGPFDATGATYLCNNEEIWLSSAQNSISPVPAVLNLISNFRPAILFDAVNTATNEIEVLDIHAAGKVSKLVNGPQVITANVVNSSIGAQNNVTVALNIAGANTFVDTQTLNLAPGAITTVSFNPFTATANGVNNMSVAVLMLDQNIANNLKSWTQSVTCGEMAQNLPNPTFNSSYGYGGTSGSGYFMAKHTTANNGSLTAIKAYIGAHTGNNNKTAWAAVADASGNILATSNTITINAGASPSFSFNPPVDLPAGDYLFGVAQPTSGYYMMAYANNNTFVPAPYYVVSLAGGTSSQVDIGGYFGIEPMMISGTTTISVSANRTAVCKDSPMPVTFTAIGADTYNWGPASSSSGSTIVVTPTVAGAQGMYGVTVSGNYTTGVAAGCKSGNAVASVSVMNCTSIMETGSNLSSVRLFPNPAVSGKTTLSGMNGAYTVTVFNVLGQAVITESTSVSEFEIDLSSMPAGNYLVKITDSDNQSKTIKVINQH